MRVLVVFVFLMGLFNCNTVPTKENLDKILNSNKVTVNLMTSRGGISGYASPRTKSKDKFEIINSENETKITYFVSAFHSDSIFKFDLNKDEIDSLFIVLTQAVKTHDPNKEYYGCCMCSNTDFYISDGNMSLDIKPSKETEYLFYNLLEKYNILLLKEQEQFYGEDEAEYHKELFGLKEDLEWVDQELNKDFIFEELFLKVMSENDIISVTEDSLFFVIPFDIHGFDCGAPDCYETVVSFGFEKSQPVKFPNQLKFSEFTLGCVEERKQVEGIFTLKEENEEVIIYNSKSSKRSLLFLKQRGNYECYAYYFDKYESHITSKNFKDLLRYNENTEENKVPFSSYILSIRNEPNYIH